MKDITAYFKSPTKSPLNSQTSPKLDQPTSSENGSEKPEVKDKSRSNKKSKKTKRKRKPTDPEVQSVAELFSANLSIVSPINSEHGSESNSQKSELDSNVDSVKLTPKVNAFDFLMNSRNNVIGSNSEGKQLEPENSTPPEDKAKLKARKKLLENWAEDKGSIKRKREEEEEIDKVINIKMKKRAKRLKKMLQVDDDQNCSLYTTTKKPRKISSSESEASSDIIEVTSGKDENLEPTKAVIVIGDEESSEDVIITESLTPKKKLKENSLLNFFGVFNQTDKNQDIEIIDKPKTKVKEVIKIKMFSPKGQSRRVSRISEKLQESNDSKTKQDTKRKKLKSEGEDVLNNSLEDFCPLDNSKKPTVDTKEKLSSKKSDNKVQNEERCTTPERRSLRKRSAINYNYQETLKYVDRPKSPKAKSKTDTKKVKKSTKKNKDEVEKINLISSDDSEESNSSNKAKKVAPVFLKATPKPKESVEVAEARKKFLMSGIPDSLKKTVEKRKKIEEKDVDVFPTISHVQQKCDSQFWNLPEPVLPLAPLSPTYQSSTPNCQNLIIKTTPYEVTLSTEVEKVKHIKATLRTIKNQNPNYPVYKVFRHICEKSGKDGLKSPGKAKKRRSKSKSSESVKTTEEVASKDQETWCEKYKPRSSQEILGNHRAVQELRTWLETWKKYSQEINSKAKVRKGFNSESEFESTDCDSRDSTWLPGNTMVLYGPTGSGKTSAIYAIANEFKFNVLELNASTKRTGKKLLQELQEATQSHQVRKSDTTSKFTKTEHNSKNKKMCILLLEDIDLIFDQDEGFLSSLSQLIVTSKRPIILTTTDKTPAHVQKFINQYECVIFEPLSMHCLAVWLQIVCLVEGLLVDKDHLGNLLEYHKGDVRRTLLQVQFWCQSGGQIEPEREFPVRVEESEVLQCSDEDLQLSEDETNVTSQIVHKNLMGSSEVFRLNRNHSIPEGIDLGVLWWNLPGVVNSTASDKSNPNKLLALSKLYDSLSVSDYLMRNTTSATSEPVVKSWTTNLLDSMELSERTVDPHWSDTNVTAEVTHALLNGHIEHYTDNCRLNLALPDSAHRKWRANQHQCDNYLRHLVPTSSALDRSSVSLDYLPALRDFVRSEERRAATNTKRGNRFRHYFREFYSEFKPVLCKKACDILNIDNRL